MSARATVKQAGIFLYPDTVDIEHVRFGNAVRKRARRFAAAQSMFMTSANDTPGIRAGRLVCLDLVHPSDLGLVLAAQAYRLRGQVCIDWTTDNDKRIDRRVLSCLTVLCPLDPSPDVQAEIDAMVKELEQVPGFKSITTSKRMVELEKDFACWAALRLPKPLWAHVTGLRPMSALPRHLLAIGEIKLVPKLQEDSERSARGVAMADMLDNTLAAARVADVQPVLVDLATLVFRMDDSETDPQTLDHWGKGLLALRERVEAADVATALVIAWDYDIVENGTATELNARLKTRGRYVRVANARLWRMLAAMPKDPGRWTMDALKAGYLAMMADESCKDLAGLGAAISSFQLFLQETFDIPALPLGLHKLIPEAIPRAQWMPDHVIARAVHWLRDDKKGDELLKEICDSKLLLAYAAPFRLSELRWLRLKNIAFAHDGSMEIEITPLAGMSLLKTEAATRRVVIRDPDVIDSTRRLIAKRQGEGAPMSALLYAAPSNDMKPYRAHAVHVTLLRLLKQASGDPTMTFHALRHTYVTDAVEILLGSPNPGSNNRLSQLADWVGHEVAVTTLKFYAHRFEFALRACLDRRLADTKLTNEDGERLIGTKANTLTQAARRAGRELTPYLFGQFAITAGKRAHVLPSAAHGLELHEPPPISLIGPLGRNFTVHACMTVMQRVSERVDNTLIEQRQGVSSDELKGLDRAAVVIATEIYASQRLLPPKEVTDVRSAIRHFEFDFGRTQQPRYADFVNALMLPQDVTLVRDAAKVWSSSWWDGTLSADPPMRLLPLLQYLKASMVSSASLLINIWGGRTDDASAESLECQALAVSAAVFHDQVHVRKPAGVGPGTARATLSWPSSMEAGAAGRSNAGFDVLMFACAVWAQTEIQEWA